MQSDINMIAKLFVQKPICLKVTINKQRILLLNFIKNKIIYDSIIELNKIY